MVRSRVMAGCHGLNFGRWYNQAVSRNGASGFHSIAARLALAAILLAAAGVAAPVSAQAVTVQPPQMLKAVPGNGEVTLAWEFDPGTNLLGSASYKRKVGNGAFDSAYTFITSGQYSAPRTTRTSDSTTNLSYTTGGDRNNVSGMRNLTNGTTYTYRIRTSILDDMYRVLGYSVHKDVPVTPSTKPSMISALTATPAGSGRITLSWTKPGDGGKAITKFQYRSKAGSAAYSGWADISGSTVDTASHTVTGLNNRTLYRFRVRAVNQDYLEADRFALASNEVSARPVPVVSITADSSAPVTEGTSATFTLTATPAPAGNITVNVTVADSGAFAGTSQTGARTVTIGTGGTGTLTVTTVGDQTDEPTGTITATISAGTGYSVHGTNGSATVTVNDDDGRGVTVSKSALTIREGGSGSYTVVLNTQPSGNVTITPSSNNTDVMLSPTPLTFTSSNWGTAQTVTVSAGSTPGSATITHTVSGADYETETAPAVAVSVTAPPSTNAAPSLPPNTAPEFTSASSVSVAENERAVLTVRAVDADEADSAVRYGISGGADQARFSIDPASGALTFTGLPDYEDPSAGGGDNEYVVIVQATSGIGDRERSAEQTITVTVTALPPNLIGQRAMPAWLARFGRAVTDPVLDAVSGRLSAPGSAGVALNLAGRALPVWNRHSVAHEYGSTEDAPVTVATSGHAVTGGLRASLARPAERGSRDALRSWLSHTGAGDDHDTPGGFPGAQSLAVQSWSPTSRDLRSGTSFALTGEPGADGGLLSFWGQGALNRFDGREDDLALDGEATTWLVGADRSRQSHTVGAMLGHSQVVGGYRSSADNGEAESGEIEATLTGVYPYTGLVVHERLSVWAVAGYGTGDLTLKPEGGGSVETGLSLTMAAAGVRSEALRAPEASGLSLAVKGDVRVTRVSSDAAGDAVAGRLLVANAEVWRARAGVEGARSFALDEKGGVVTPSFEVGARFDGGDAETGFGADIGGGVALVAPGHGVTAALKARGLVAHKDQDLREWGVSAAFAWDPRPQTQRGWSLSLMQSWGASSSGGMEALLSRDTLAGLSANDESPASQRLEVELGYGLAVFGGDFTGAPNAGVALTGGGRDWRFGWRLTPAWPDASGFEVNLDVLRNEVDGKVPEHAVTLRGGIRF